MIASVSAILGNKGLSLGAPGPRSEVTRFESILDVDEFAFEMPVFKASESIHSAATHFQLKFLDMGTSWTDLSYLMPSFGSSQIMSRLEPLRPDRLNEVLQEG